MRLIVEDYLFEKYTGYDFVTLLVEILKTDKIGVARDVVKAEFGSYAKSKDIEYLKKSKMLDEKRDLLDFAKEWINDVSSIHDIKSVKVHDSRQVSFSLYIDVVIKKPENPELEQFYNSHKGRYKNVSFKFTDHFPEKNKTNNKNKKACKNYRDHNGKYIRGEVDYSNKSFLEASFEMLDIIKNYISNLHTMENDYLEQIKGKEDSETHEEP